MKLLESIVSQSNVYDEYEKVDRASQAEWDSAMAKIQNELESEAQKYLAQERIRAAKTAELSKLRMLG